MKYTPEQLSEMKLDFINGTSLFTLSKKFGGYPNSVKRSLYKKYPNIAKERDLVSKQTFYKLIDIWKTVYGERECEFVVAEFLSRFDSKKQNVIGKTNWDFTITPFDLKPLRFCPYVGLELNWEGFGKQEDNISFDRIDNTKGYISGNVTLCSWRGNRLKNDGTESEHRKIADFIQNHL